MKLPTAPKKKELDVTRFVTTLYSMPKTGKTTFAAQFPDAVFLCTENGTKFVEVCQITNDDGEPIVLKTWKEFKDAVRMLLTTPHNFRTVVIDTIDNCGDLCVREVNTANGFSHESQGAYGLGSALIKREFKLVIDALLASGMGVVFISHEKESEKEDRGVKRKFTDLSLPNTFKGYITGASDFILYAFRDSNGKRLMRTKANDNYQAGDRSALLPEIMPLDYKLMVSILQGSKEKIE